MAEHGPSGEKLNIAGKLAGLFMKSKITAMLMLSITLIGVMALFVTPREYNPQIVVPAANIIVARPGADPTEVANMVVKPLEAIMNAMSGVDHTFGYAVNDMGVVTVQFKVGEDQERSLVKLYNQLMQNLDRMPPGTQEPLVKPINADDVPVMAITFASRQFSDAELRGVVERVLEQLRNVPGVSFTQIVGGRQRAVNVWLDPQRLTAMGLSLDQVDRMLQAANVSLPAGELSGGNVNAPLRVSGYLGNAEEIGKVLVGAPQGRPIYLKDVARIEEGPGELEQLSRFAFGPAAQARQARGDMAAVTVALAKKPGTNAVVVTRAVRERLASLERTVIPEGITAVVTRDDGERANDAVNTLVEHLGIAIGSVVLILVLFLGWREAAIVTLTVPLILFVVLAVGLMAGQTINRITLFALILSLGLLVDAAIVVIENIHRHLHQGAPRPFDAVLVDATNEIGNPTNIATIAVIVAFIPMAFVTGMMGPFMRPIPFNVPVAMIASLLIAYMVVPWAAWRWLSRKAAKQALRNRESLAEQGQNHQDFLHRGYVAVITPLLRNGLVRSVFLLTVVLLLLLVMLQPAWQFIRPQGMNGPLSPLGVELKMLPNDDVDTFLVEVDTPAGTSLISTGEVTQAVADVIGRQSLVTNYQTFLGIPAPVDFAALVRGDLMKRGSNLAQIRVNLVDKHDRSTSSHEIVRSLDRDLAPLRKRFPQARIKLYEQPPGPPVQAQILAQLYGPDYERLRASATDVSAAFERIYGMVNVDDSVTANLASYTLHVDRQKAALAGVAPAQVAKLLHDYVSGFSMGTLHVAEAREPIDIIVRLPRESRATPAQILSLYVTNAMGKPVALSAIARISPSLSAKPIYFRDQNPVVFVSGELLRSSPVYAVLSLDQMLDGRRLPHSGVSFETGNLGFNEVSPEAFMGYKLLWGGEMRLTLDVFRDLGSAFMVALVFIYLVLVAYYKSFMLPVIVMGAIPLTLIGVFPGHWITQQAFTATSMIGVIALAGIVVRNSLLLIDFVLDYRARGYALEDAVIEAGAVRFRPILLTALAIILGSAIMITDPVFGGLAVSLIFGTFASTALTLLVIPLAYFLWQRRLGDGRRADA
ncbi:efflux RND transporter permease subunit [Thermithiobacillus plumbiphilus]|uniref:Efflux RND transporter permease subunit n=1 Tax=Thermithiobacillus plumbiphilus TaxID=1729899 RepID=A0ABU9DBW9_9PROT